jgi:hypothetical protein
MLPTYTLSKGKEATVLKTQVEQLTQRISKVWQAKQSCKKDEKKIKPACETAEKEAAEEPFDSDLWSILSSAWASCARKSHIVDTAARGSVQTLVIARKVEKQIEGLVGEYRDGEQAPINDHGEPSSPTTTLENSSAAPVLSHPPTRPTYTLTPAEELVVLKIRLAQLTLRVEKIQTACDSCQEAKGLACQEKGALREKRKEEAADIDLADHYTARELAASCHYDLLISQSIKLQVSLIELKESKAKMEKNIRTLKTEVGDAGGNVSFREATIRMMRN